MFDFSAVAPVVQADWKDVVALIPLKDAPEPDEGWIGFACKQQGSRETLSEGHLIQVWKGDAEELNEVRNNKTFPWASLSGHVGWGDWFCWYSVWFDVFHLHHSGSQCSNMSRISVKCVAQIYFCLLLSCLTLGKSFKLCGHEEWIYGFVATCVLFLVRLMILYGWCNNWSNWHQDGHGVNAPFYIKQ